MVEVITWSKRKKQLEHGLDYRWTSVEVFAVALLSIDGFPNRTQAQDIQNSALFSTCNWHVVLWIYPCNHHCHIHTLHQQTIRHFSQQELVLNNFYWKHGQWRQTYSSWIQKEWGEYLSSTAEIAIHHLYLLRHCRDLNEFNLLAFRNTSHNLHKH